MNATSHLAPNVTSLREFARLDGDRIGGVRADAATDAPAARVRLRLTRRGRAVFGTLAVLLCLGLLAVAAVFGSTQAVAAAEGGDVEFGYVVVQPGASLWSLASQLDPDADPRDLIAEIVRLNQLDGAGLQAGDAIAVPLRFADSPGVVNASDLGLAAA